jgi:UDP-2,3-diacylglucosamine hydrolase
VPEPKPVFVASDAHLGAAPPAHQRAFLLWLEHAAAEASEIILNGDLFDFWFEYRWGVTRGHGEVLVVLHDIVRSGVPVTLVGGSHDWWGGGHLREQVGLTLLDRPTRRRVAGRETLVAHGDGLGQGDVGYRMLRRVLRSPLTRLAYGMLPVRLGDRIARGVSRTEHRWDQWGAQQQARSEALEAWALDTLGEDAELELVLLGHTHLPMVREAEPGRWYVNTGDWVFHQSYVTLRENEPPRLLDWRERGS